MMIPFKGKGHDKKMVFTNKNDQTTWPTTREENTQKKKIIQDMKQTNIGEHL